MKITHLFLLSAAFALVVMAIANTFLPLWALAIIIGFAFLSTLTMLSKKKNTILKWILSAVLLLSSLVLYTTHQGIDGITNNVAYETTTFSFIVLKDSSITSLKDTEGMTYGIRELTDNITVAFIQGELMKEIDTYKWKQYEDNENVINALYSGEIKIMIIDDAMRSAIDEQMPDFSSRTVEISSIEKQYEKEVDPDRVKSLTKPFVLFLSGIDTLGPISTLSRSDVDILIVVNPLTHKILTISIPRDTYIHLGCKTGALDKLSFSGIYGIQCTIRSIENHMGINIDYYIKLNFSSFMNIIDYFGRINVYSEFAFTSSPNASLDGITYDFIKGINSLDSKTALAFARERHAFVTHNFQRGQNQMEIIKAVLKKVLTPSSLLNINKLIGIVNKNIDTNITSAELNALIKLQIENNKGYQVNTALLSCKDDMQPTYSYGKQPLYVCWTYPSSLTNLKTKIDDLMKEK